jgi:hypothetical protein
MQEADMRQLIGQLAIVVIALIGASAHGQSSEACQAVALTGDLLHFAFGRQGASSVVAQQRAATLWQQQIDIEIRRMEIGIQMFRGGPVPPDQYPFSVDQVRYICTPEARDAFEPRPCRFGSDPDSQTFVQGAIRAMQQNLAGLREVQASLRACGGGARAGRESGGFQLVDETGVGNAGSRETTDVAEPGERRGDVYWPPWMVEKNPQISQVQRDAMVAIWQQQVKSMLVDFTALNFENGIATRPDVKFDSERDGTFVYYRDGQPVVRFYAPKDVFLRVYVEVPFAFRNQLGGTSAIMMMLKRTNLGNYAITEHRYEASLSAAGEDILIERSIFDLEAIDQSLDVQLKELKLITKGLEARIEQRLGRPGQTSIRAKIAAGLVWYPGRVFGAVAGAVAAAAWLTPWAHQHFGPEVAGAVGSATLLSGMLVFSKAFKYFSDGKQAVKDYFDKAHQSSVARLNELEARIQDIDVLRGEMAEMRLQLNNPSKCRLVSKELIKDLIQRGEILNGL